MMGPLHGLKVIEFAGIGPGPFAAMLFADMGAEVVRIERKSAVRRPLSLLNLGPLDVTSRGRRAVGLDIKRPEGRDAALRLIDRADALIEGFRPGVMERLGLGPDPCLARNAKLVYGRMTGWGQDGPLAHTAGHDITYIALSGALHAIGTPEQPLPPLNLVGDFGGGAMMLAWGMMAALWEAQRSGQGQVVDAAMVDGAAYLMAMLYGVKAAGLWSQQRGANLLDGGAFFYGTYACSDGKFVAVGPIEPQFYAEFLARLGSEDPDLASHYDPSAWPQQRAKLAAILLTKPRDEWCALFEGTDACVAPVLDMDEAPDHPHNRARATFITVDDVLQPAPAPRLSRTPAAIQGPPPAPGADTEAVLLAWGFGETEVAALRAAGAIE
ncbi:MAG: CoA transferase [Caldilineaceae bacterium]|nr:CoA transferase [Caldilineaceae bacterium]MCB9120936.1 CoA transferase [Caldilineaceae bacterium]